MGIDQVGEVGQGRHGWTGEREGALSGGGALSARVCYRTVAAALSQEPKATATVFLSCINIDT